MNEVARPPDRIRDLSALIDFRPTELGPGGGEYLPVATLEHDGVANAMVKIDLHAGTHIDPPSHFIAGGQSITELPVQTFFGRVALAQPRAPIIDHRAVMWSELEWRYRAPDQMAGFIVLLNSGWAEKHYGRAEYYPQAPYLDASLADTLVRSGAKCVVLDFPPDRLDITEAKRLTVHDAPAHKMLLGAGIPIVENVIGMSEIRGDEVWFQALPLRINEACGGPARAVALEWDSEV